MVLIEQYRLIVELRPKPPLICIPPSRIYNTFLILMPGKIIKYIFHLADIKTPVL